jgi:hypothetical protein
MFNQAEIQEAQDLQDQLDAEWAHQQSVDESHDQLTAEDIREMDIHRLQCEVVRLMGKYGRMYISETVADTIDNAFNMQKDPF